MSNIQGRIKALKSLGQSTGKEKYTVLSPDDEQDFRSWVKTNKVPFDPSEAMPDYDMRGFWKAAKQGDPRASTAVDPEDKQIHYDDYWKMPWHRGYSTFSKEATADAPTWIGNKLVPASKADLLFNGKIGPLEDE